MERGEARDPAHGIPTRPVPGARVAHRQAASTMAARRRRERRRTPAVPQRSLQQGTPAWLPAGTRDGGRCVDVSHGGHQPDVLLCAQRGWAAGDGRLLRHIARLTGGVAGAHGTHLITPHCLLTGLPTTPAIATHRLSRRPSPNYQISSLFTCMFKTTSCLKACKSM